MAWLQCINFSVFHRKCRYYKKCYSLQLILQYYLDKKDSRVAYIITRLNDNEGNRKYNAVSASAHESMWTESSTQTSGSTYRSRSPTQHENSFTREPQDGKHVQMEDTVDDHFLREREKVSEGE